MFQGDVSRQTFVKRLLGSAEVNASTEIFPRCGVFDDLSESNQANVVTVMTDVAIKIVQLLLPRDAEKGAASLLERMMQNPRFQRFALPNLNNTSRSSYEEWVKNPVVSSIKQAVTMLGKTNQPLREQLRSLLSPNYPKSWLQEHFEVGRTTTMRAADHAKAFGAGQTLLGLRDAQRLTGIHVCKIHFNASGEGKRWETDGHNTDIKVRREHAMRASKCSALSGWN
jgi:hypothetical protein